MKCPDCGRLLEKGQIACPNCGCPAEVCKTEMRQKGTVETTSEKRTTDTGYVNEKTIKAYADIIFGLSVIFGVSLWICFIYIMAHTYEDNGLIIGFLFGGIALALHISLAYVSKAFIRTFANISINLHEINNKIQ